MANKDDENDGTPNFSLVAWPRTANQHSSSCNPPPTEHLVREFRKLCYDAVKEDPFLFARIQGLKNLQANLYDWK